MTILAAFNTRLSLQAYRRERIISLDPHSLRVNASSSSGPRVPLRVLNTPLIILSVFASKYAYYCPGLWFAGTVRILKFKPRVKSVSCDVMKEEEITTIDMHYFVAPSPQLRDSTERDTENMYFGIPLARSPCRAQTTYVPSTCTSASLAH